MMWWRRGLYGLCTWTALVLTGAMLLAWPVQAKQGFFVGGGLVEQSTGGDLDGDKAVQLDTGRGLGLKVGYGFSRNFAVEYLMLNSDHTATTKYDSLDRDARLNGNTIALRATGRITSGLEGFVRLGNSSLFGGYSLEVTELGTTRDLDGNGTAFGGGLEWFLGSRTGVEISYMRHEVTLEREATLYATANDNLNVSIDSILVMIGFYF